MTPATAAGAARAVIGPIFGDAVPPGPPGSPAGSATVGNPPGRPGCGGSAGQRLADLGLCGALTASAGLSLHRAIDAAQLIPIVAVAATGPVLLAGALSIPAARRSRGVADRAVGGRGKRLVGGAAALPPRSLWLAVAMSGLAWLLVMTATLLRPLATLHLLPNVSTLAATAAALGTGWRQVFAVVLPAGAEPDVLVTAHGLVWLAAAAAAETVLRTRATLPALLGPAAVLLAGLLTGVGAGSDVPATAAFVAAAALLLVVRRPDGHRGRYRAGLPAVACVVAVAALLGPRLPIAHARAPFDAQRHVSVAAAPQPALDPLDQVSAWLATPEVHLFTVAAPSPQRWRVAVLDSFDGTTWHGSGRFLQTGSRVPPIPEPIPHPTIVDQTVHIAGLTGVWLPAAATPTAVRGPHTLVEPETGVLLAPAGLRPGLTYRVTSAVPDYRPDEMVTAAPADDAIAQADLSLPPGLPDSVATLAQRAAAGAGYPLQQAARLERYLREAGHYDPAAPPGHSYGHLAYFLNVAHRGTSEQFATAFAVMARTLGLPSRVVVGFRAGAPIGDGSWLVTGADALVWPEVDFQDLGWVPFFPTPDTATAATGDHAAAAGADARRQQIDATINQVPPPSTGPASPGAGSATARTATATPWWPVAAAGVALLVGYLLFVLLLPCLRSRSRRRNRGGAAVAAAWQEVRYRLRMAGLVITDTMTTAETAEAAGRVLDRGAAVAMARLAALTDAAAFGPDAVEAEQGDRAWRDADAVAAGVRRVTPARRRLSRRLLPTLRA